MDKKPLTEADIRTKFITPALRGGSAGKWHAGASPVADSEGNGKGQCPTSRWAGRLLEAKPVRVTLPFVLPRNPRQWTVQHNSRGYEPARWRSG